MAIICPTIFVLSAFLFYSSALPEPDFKPNLHKPMVIRPTYNPYRPPKLVFPTYKPENPPKFVRTRRFTDRNNFAGGQNQWGNPQQQPKQPQWEIRPDLNRDRNGNTNGQVTIKKRGENYDLNAGWGKTIRGPNKHSETWNVGGSYKW